MLSFSPFISTYATWEGEGKFALGLFLISHIFYMHITLLFLFILFCPLHQRKIRIASDLWKDAKIFFSWHKVSLMQSDVLEIIKKIGIIYPTAKMINIYNSKLQGGNEKFSVWATSQNPLYQVKSFSAPPCKT